MAWNALLAGETHEVPHDQKIVGEAQLVDHVQLAIEPGHHLVRELAVGTAVGPIGIALLQARQAQLAQILLGRLALGQREHRKMPLAQLQFDVDAVGDFLRASQGVVQAGKGRVHLLGAAEIELVALHPHAVGVGAELARVDAQQDVLGLGVLAVDVVDVAGGHQGNAQPMGHLDRPLHRQPLRFQVVVLNLDVVVVAEEFLEPGGDFQRPFPCWPRRRPASCGSVRWRRSRSGRSALRDGRPAVPCRSAA